jgi:hypothetical protein
MNLNEPRHPWSRLVAAARHAPDGRDTVAPYGFATRVVALAFARERAVVSLFDRFALRALGLACLLAVLSVAVNYSALTKSVLVEDELPADDTVALLLDA